jgi:hypothetical protein
VLILRLPAVASAASASASAASAAAAAGSLLLWLGLVDSKASTFKVSAVHFLDRFFSLGLRTHFYETKTPGPTGHSVCNHAG